MPCFIIAEAGVNHNGSLDLALSLVDAAADAGADAVKFQTFKADSLVKRGTARAEYQLDGKCKNDQHEMIAALELNESQHEAICKRCAIRGIEFMSTPFDLWALDLLVGLGVRRLKIPSGELTNRPFIESIAQRGLPMILSSGMATLDEVKRTLSWLVPSRQKSRLQDWLTVLHCTSNYPTAPSDVNLLAMRTLESALGIPVGYSDHTLGIDVPIAAVALGATIIEKHFTLDQNLPGPDHKMSLNPAQLSAMIAGVRNVELALGNGIKEPTPTELPIRRLVRRSAFTRNKLPAGHTIELNDIEFLRPGDGIGPEFANELLGRKIVCSLAAGHRLDWKDLM